jgi:hypothetical protein
MTVVVALMYLIHRAVMREAALSAAPEPAPAVVAAE